MRKFMRKGRRSIALMILSVGAIAVLLLGIGFLSVGAGAQQRGNEEARAPKKNCSSPQPTTHTRPVFCRPT